MLVKLLRYQDIARTMQPLDEIVFETTLVRAGRFRCAPGDARFCDSGPTQNWLVAFPRTAVRIRHAGSREFVADPTISTIYNSGQEYTRGAISGDGDRSEWFGVASHVATEIAARLDPSAVDRPGKPFAREYAPVEGALYLAQRQLFSRLANGAIDVLEAEESIIDLASAVLRRAYDQRVTQARPRAAETRRDLVTRARAALLVSITDKVTLATLAKQLGTSEFHLCRVFREETGMTLHAFRTDVRLRRGLEMLGDSSLDLSRIALELGFSSHSHFSDTMRRRFGSAPAIIRRSLTS